MEWSPVPSLPPFSLLLVEDDKLTREVVARMVTLKFPQGTIYTAENGIVGVELFRKYAPDIVITDINMPEMDGNEMVREIKTINPNFTYIMLSANNEVKSAKKSGYCAYLMKPLDFKALFDAIAHCQQEADAPLHIDG